MQLDTFEEGNGFRVWLNTEERDRLLEEYDADPYRQISIELMGLCGCRVTEVLKVTRNSVRMDSSGHWFLHLSSGSDGGRKTPMPSNLAGKIRASAATLDGGEPIFNTTSRTLRRWVLRAAEQRAEAENDERWHYVGPQDLRLTWGDLLLKSRVQPSIVMSWGGWTSYENFLNHFSREHSDGDHRQEAERVDWL